MAVAPLPDLCQEDLVGSAPAAGAAETADAVAVAQSLLCQTLAHLQHHCLVDVAAAAAATAVSGQAAANAVGPAAAAAQTAAGPHPKAALAALVATAVAAAAAAIALLVATQCSALPLVHVPALARGPGSNHEPAVPADDAVAIACLPHWSVVAAAVVAAVVVGGGLHVGQLSVAEHLGGR